MRRMVAVVVAWAAARSFEGAGRAGPCAAAVAPGAWSGTVQMEVAGQGESLSSDRLHRIVNNLKETIDAKIALRVACNGAVTGSLSNMQLRLSLDVVGTNTKSKRSAVIVATTCNATSQVRITSGKVTTGPGGLPVFTMKGTVTQESFECTGDLANELGKEYKKSKGSVGYEATFTARAAAANATTISGTSWESSDLDWTTALGHLPVVGIKPTVTLRWRLSLVGADPVAPPVPKPKPTPDPPVITSLDAQYAENFLQGVKSVPNRYTAAVDWGEGTPGKVIFTMPGAPRPVESTSAPYAATFEMGDLPGSAVLEVVAVNGEGQSSAPRQMGVTIVPLPGWAKKIAWTVQLEAGYVLYEGEKPFPDKPISFGFQVPASFPYVGGPWGLQPTQFKATLQADSRGQQATAPITGTGNFSLGTKYQYDASFSGDCTTLLGSTELAFLRGKAAMTFRPPFYKDAYANLLDGVPGLGSALASVEKYIGQLATARAIFQATLQGEGDLAVKDDDLVFRNGRGTLIPQVDLIPIRLGSDKWAFVELKGVASGSVTFDFTPTFRVSTCFLSFRIIGERYIRFFGYSTFLQTPSVDYVCRVTSSSTAPVVAPSSPVASTRPQVLPRPPGWKPPRAVAERFTTAGGLSGTTLVKGAGPDASPALAVSPSGGSAFAYVTEDAAKPRPRASEIAVRLNDGKKWGKPIAVTRDTRPAFTPQVAYDGKDQLIVAWGENRLDDLGAGSQPDERFLSNLEVAYAVLDAKTGKIATTGALTQDDAVNSDLRLTRGNDGAVWALWRTGSKQSRVEAAVWNGSGWGKPELVADMPDATWWSPVARDAGRIMVVADSDSDGDFSTTADREIVVRERTASGWGAARRLTRNKVADVAPLAAYAPKGEPVVAWYSEGKVMGLAGNLAAAPSAWFAATPDTGGALGAGTLLATAGGKLEVLWPGAGNDGANLVRAKYDPSSRKWSAPAPLLDGPHFVTNLSAAPLPNGRALLGFAQPDLGDLQVMSD